MVVASLMALPLAFMNTGVGLGPTHNLLHNTVQPRMVAAEDAAAVQAQIEALQTEMKILEVKAQLAALQAPSTPTVSDPSPLATTAPVLPTAPVVPTAPPVGPTAPVVPTAVLVEAPVPVPVLGP